MKTTPKSRSRSERIRILSIDPGYDVTGWAVFRVDVTHPPNSLNGALELVEESGDLTTSTGDSQHYRLRSLGIQMKNLVQMWEPSIVYMERPAYAGDYGGKRARRPAVNKLHMAMGALLSGIPVAPGPRVVLVPAIRTPKETRHELLGAVSRVSGVSLPAGPRGGSKQDELDALWLGCQALLERVVKDTVSNRHT